MQRREVNVIKASGESEPFNADKLKRSLRRAGATSEACNSIVEHVLEELQPGMSTTHIYRHAFSLLRKIEQRPVAARYSMRRAVFGLGPTGFPFEGYVAEVYRHMGYQVENGVMIEGKCAEHEVDLIAYNETECIAAELKFHNSPGIKTDLKTALYVRERFDDIQKKPHHHNDFPNISRGILITNTKFTRSAIEYGKCAQLELLGWNYPKKNNLEDMIRKTGIYPITALTTLTQREKIALLSQKIVMCNGLAERNQVLEEIGVAPEKIATVIEESQALCSFSDKLE